MAKSRAKKVAEVQLLTERLKRMKVAVLTTTSGLTVKDMNQLRSVLRGSGIDHVVAKKTLIRRALEQVPLEGIDLSTISTSFALTFGYDDDVAPARLLAQFAKTHESLTFLGGVLEGKLVDAETMKALSALPSREEMRGRTVRVLAAPLTGFVSVLVENLHGLVRVINAYRSQSATA